MSTKDLGAKTTTEKKKKVNVKLYKQNVKAKQPESTLIEELQKKYENIDIGGITKFTDLPLSSKTLKGLKECGYMQPTEIQRETILLGLQGKDVLGAAQTGSGKTLAFLIPLLEVLYCKRWTNLDGIGALVITPTRELAYQIFECLRKVGKHHDFSAGLIIGGKDLKFERKRLDQCNIMICTPGRLLQHMDENPLFDCVNMQVKDFLSKQKLPIKALLLLDNAPSHPPEEQLRSKDGSIFVMYMPPNVTPLIQPMDQNVIKLTKLYYRKFLLSSVLSKNPENISESLKQVTLREAVLNLHMAWNALNQQTIQKCWNNLFCTSDEHEYDADVLVSASSDVIDLLKIVNPNILCTLVDINLWNEDKQMNDVKEEEDEGSDDEDLPLEARSAVTDEQAVELFNQALDWAERKEVSNTDILVLHKLRATALEGIAKHK